MADISQDESSLADSIIQKVAQEQAYQDLQDRLKAAEEECLKERQEKEKLKAEKDELATSNAQLQEASSNTQATFASISSNVRDYETRIRLLEREKEELRQDFSQLKQKSRTDNDLVRKYRETSESDGRQIRQLDVERSEAIYAKNKMEHQQKILASALETVRKESEMYSKALIDKEAEFASYRSSHYMELQQAMLERDREAQLRLQVEKARDQITRQYQQNLDALQSAQMELTSLQSKLSKKSSDFRADASALQKRIDSLEARSKEDREAVEGLEEAFREAQEVHAQRVEAYEIEIEAAANRQIEAEGKMEEMARTVELLSQGVNGESSFSGLGGNAAGELANLVGSGSSIGGKTLRQALAEVVRLQAESAKLKVENERLESLCRSVLRDLEERKPVLDQQRAEYFRMKASADDLARRLAETIQAKEFAEAELVDLKSKLTDSSTENKTLRSQAADLGMQVRVLTREIAIRDEPALAYEVFDPVGQDHPEVSDIDAVITNNLTAFKKLPQLLEQNKKLLRISRELGRKLEEKSSSSSSGKDASDDDLDNAAQAIESLTETVNSLRSQVVDSRTQLELSIKERDMYSRLLVQGSMMLGMSTETVHQIANGDTAHSGSDVQDNVVRNVLAGIQAEFEKHREDLRCEVKRLQTQVDERTRDTEAERERTASALASLRHEQNQNLALTQRMEQEKSDLTTHLSTIAIREAEILNLRGELARITNEENHLRAQKSHLQSFVDGLNAQKEMLQANELAANTSTNELLQEKARLSRELDSRKLLHNQELLVAQNAKQEVESSLESLRHDLENARNALAEQRTANQILLTAQRSPELQKKIDELESSLADLTKDRDEKIGKLQEALDAAKSDVQTKLNIGLKWQKRTKELMSGINETKETHAKAIDDLQAQVTSLNQQIETLQSENASLKQEVETKSRRADDLQSRITGLEQSLAEREQAIQQASAASSATIPVPAVSEPLVDASAVIQGSLDQAQQRIIILENQLAEAIQARDNAVAERTLSQVKPTAVVTDPLAEQALREELSAIKTQHAQALEAAEDRTASAQRVIESLNLRVTTLEKELTEAQKQVNAVQEMSSQKPDETLEPGEIKPEAVPTNTTSEETNPDSQKAFEKLQAQFDQYKTEQSTKYEQGVMKVNSANVKLKQENQQWRGVRLHIETLQKEYKTPTQGGNFDLNTAIDEIVEVLRTERDTALATASEAVVEKAKLETALEEAKAKVAAAASSTANVSKPASDTADSAQIEALQKEKDQLRQQIEALTTQCRASEEKAAKAAVKASMADKYKKDLTELRQKLAQNQAGAGPAAPAAPPPGPGVGFSIKGESAPSPASASTEDAIDLNATAAQSIRGTRGARGGAVRGTATRGVTRGAARGRGRGGKLDVASVLAAVEQGFGNGAQKRRSSDTQGNPTENQDASKRAKLDQPPSSGDNGNPPAP